MTTYQLIDASYLYALYSSKDPRHAMALKFADDNTELPLVPSVVLPEVGYLFLRDLGHYGLRTFLTKFASTGIAIVELEEDDLARAGEIMNQYATAEFDLVDCCIMAMAERLNITTILTFDRRDFSIFRPAHCHYFDLAP